LLVRALISRGAKPANAPGGGLFAAAWWGDRDIIKLLLNAGATIDIVVGVTPFLASWCWRRFEGAKALAELGANVNYQDPKKGKTALQYGIEKEFAPADLTWLVRHGASPDLKDHDGATARSRVSRKRDRKWLEHWGDANAALNAGDEPSEGEQARRNAHAVALAINRDSDRAECATGQQPSRAIENEVVGACAGRR
jgi:hypothetical protein